MTAAALLLSLCLPAGSREIVDDIVLPAPTPAGLSTMTQSMLAPGEGYALYSEACPVQGDSTAEYRRGEHWIYHGNERLSEEICWTSSPGVPQMSIRPVRGGRLGPLRQIRKGNFTLQRETSPTR